MNKKSLVLTYILGCLFLSSCNDDYSQTEGFIKPACVDRFGGINQYAKEYERIRSDSKGFFGFGNEKTPSEIKAEIETKYRCRA